MELTLRPFVTAGVAVIAAGAIAVAPVASPAQEARVSAPRVVSEAVQLVVDPITAYTQLITSTITSLEGLVSLATSQGLVPILQQFLVNQLTYAQDIGGGLVTGTTGFVNDLLTVSLPSFQQALGLLLSGDVLGATASLAKAISVPPQTFFKGVTAGVQAVLTAFTKHISNLAADYTEIVSFLYQGLTLPPLSALVGAGEAVQNVVDALNPFNPVGLLDAFIAAPAVFLNNTLNSGGGLLGIGGPIAAALEIRNLVAVAIDPPPPPWLSGLAAANATPKTPAKTVALTTAGLATGTKLSTGTTTPPGNTTSPGAPGKSAKITVVEKTGGLNLNHTTAKTTRK